MLGFHIVKELTSCNKKEFFEKNKLCQIFNEGCIMLNKAHKYQL